jgi:hypothetical protein
MEGGRREVGLHIDQFGTRGKKFEQDRLARKDKLYLTMAEWLTGVFGMS